MDGPKELCVAYTLRNGFAISESHDQAIHLILVELVQKIPARRALVGDTAGQIIAFSGETGAIDLVALGSLVAGDLAASQAIAQLTGEYEGCQVVAREGQHNNTFILEAGRHLALLVQVPSDVPLGWARVLVLEAARRLATLLDTSPEPAGNAHVVSELEQSGLADLFDHALDSVWSGDDHVH